MPNRYAGYHASSDDRGVIASSCLLIIALLVLALAVGAAIIMGVWNFVLVPVFGIGTIGWGQALLIYLAIHLIGSAFKRSPSSK